MPDQPEDARSTLDQLAALHVNQSDVLAALCQHMTALMIATKVLVAMIPRDRGFERKLAAAFDAASDGLDPTAAASARRLLNLPPKLSVVE